MNKIKLLLILLFFLMLAACQPQKTIETPTHKEEKQYTSQEVFDLATNELEIEHIYAKDQFLGFHYEYWYTEDQYYQDVLKTAIDDTVIYFAFFKTSTNQYYLLSYAQSWSSNKPFNQAYFLKEITSLHPGALERITQTLSVEHQNVVKKYLQGNPTLELSNSSNQKLIINYDNDIVLELYPNNFNIIRHNIRLYSTLYKDHIRQEITIDNLFDYFENETITILNEHQVTKKIIFQYDFKNINGIILSEAIVTPNITFKHKEHGFEVKIDQEEIQTITKISPDIGIEISFEIDIHKYGSLHITEEDYEYLNLELSKLFFILYYN